jgi:hypothetical protein
VQVRRRAVMRKLVVNSWGELEPFCISHHLDELLLGKQLLGKQLGATLVHYVVCRCSNVLPSIG